MRKSTLYIGLTALGAFLLAGMIIWHPMSVKQVVQTRLERERTLVSQLQLTDIALFTEASYTRHPNLADRFVAFQNHPMCISQFPSESLIVPPKHLIKDSNRFKGEGTP